MGRTLERAWQDVRRPYPDASAWASHALNRVNPLLGTAISPDSKTVASGYEHGQVRIGGKSVRHDSLFVTPGQCAH